MPLDAGTRLGPYEIIAALGQGGMGEVYRARDTRLDRTVAVKVLPAALAADGLRARFEREARAISSIQHPHICALFDVGEAPRPAADASVPQEGTPSPTTIRYLVLEYLEGETLADRLARAGPLPVAEALQIAIEICDALDKAHRLGIVHRDLKPANVFLARNGRSTSPFTTKLLDFGLAKTAAPVVAAGGLSLLPTTPPNLTAQGTILGTFQYMAPEQIEGAEADARTDISRSARCSSRCSPAGRHSRGRRARRSSARSSRMMRHLPRPCGRRCRRPPIASSPRASRKTPTIAGRPRAICGAS